MRCRAAIWVSEGCDQSQLESGHEICALSAAAVGWYSATTSSTNCRNLTGHLPTIWRGDLGISFFLAGREVRSNHASRRKAAAGQVVASVVLRPVLSRRPARLFDRKSQSVQRSVDIAPKVLRSLGQPDLAIFNGDTESNVDTARTRAEKLIGEGARSLSAPLIPDRPPP